MVPLTDVAQSELLAEVVRSDFVEGCHRGSVIALAADGSELWRIGDPDRPVFPRSSNKPIQAVGMLRAGLNLDGELLALACASHSGEAFHIDGVRRILALAGLDESALQTPPDYPVDEQEKVAFIRAGQAPSAIAMNCSGKHAAMLATCVANDWPIETYPETDHPLQKVLHDTVADVAGEQIAAVGVDGCGAPLFALTLTGLARAFSRIATAPAGTEEARVATAIRGYPDWLGGTRRDVTALIAAVPGMIAKDGAEGVYAAALPDGRAIALKVDDGGQRARPPVMVAALRRLGVDVSGLDDYATAPLLRWWPTRGRDPLGDLMTQPYDDAALLPGGPRLALRRTDGERRPILLVHGLSSNARTWDAVAAHLAAAGHEVVAVDQRGHGHSEQCADGYTTTQCADDLARLVEQLGFTGDRAPVVAGQSWGANVVADLAARHGDVAGLALVDGGWIRLSRQFATFDDCWAALTPPRFDNVRADRMTRRLSAAHPDWSEEGLAGTMANFEILDDGTVRPWLRLANHREIVRSLFEGDPQQAVPEHPRARVADPGRRRSTQRIRRGKESGRCRG